MTAGTRWPVIGHERAVAELERGVDGGHCAHAYLLVGPAQVGKARLAMAFASALNCTSTERPCGACRSCRLISTAMHPDVEVVTIGGLCDEAEHDHRKDNSKDIRICQIRRVERVIALQPFEARMRVIVVDPADAMNVHAADAFLKTLEEPPERVVLFLIATGEGALPETVVSRCRRIPLAPLPLGQVEALLRERGAPAEQAALLARLSGGRLGWALATSDNQALFTEREARLDRLERLTVSGRTERMLFAAELATRFARERQDVYAYLDLWLSWWRDLLLASQGCSQLCQNSDRLPALERLAGVIPAAAIVQSLRALRDCRRQLEENANVRLALEVLALRLGAPVMNQEAGRRLAASR